MQSNGNHPENNEFRKKQKRNRKATECSVKRRSKGCGVCGSENLASQGVLYCEICGAEIDYLVAYRNHWRVGYNTEPECDCVESWTYKNKTRHSRKIKSIGVLKCLDCGSVGRESFCPNYGPNHHGNYYGPSTCWKHWNGETYCQKCGFRTQ